MQEVDIDASKEDAKNIYEKISSYLPIYSLFQSDRKNTDSDNEVQDPLKEAIKQILGQGIVQKQLADIAEIVETELKNVAMETLEKLKEIDPVSYETIHENNIKRVIRALEFYHQNHTPISAHNEKEHQKISPYRFAYFVLTDEREKLYRRIDQRVDLMMEQGLLTEVKTLYDMGCRKDMVSMQGLGYKEILDYLDGSCSLEEAVYVIKRETRHFAKRQLTWFRREKDVIWLDKSEFNDREDQMLQKMTDVLHEKGIIQ